MEIVLVVVIVALLADRGWNTVLNHRYAERLLSEFADERRTLLNRIEAKHAGEFVAMERVTTPKPKKEPSENGLQPGEHPVGL